MAEGSFFDQDEPRGFRTPRNRGGGRVKWFVIAGVAVIVLLLLLGNAVGIYTNALWFSSLHHSGVYSTMLVTRVALFALGFVVMGGAVTASMYAAYRFRPTFHPIVEHSSLQRYRALMTPGRWWAIGVVAVIAGLSAGSSASGHWRTWLLWQHAQPFGQEDSYFHRDIGFYVFELPMWQYLVSFLIAVIVVSLIAGFLMHYVFGGVRLIGGRGERFSRAAQVQLSLLLGLFVLALAASYFVGRYNLVLRKSSLFTGVTYTADHAVLPSRNILAGIALICAILFIVNIWRRTWQLPVAGLALLVLSGLVIGLIYPGVVQQFQVKPSQADKERDYLAANIESTRTAYGIEGAQLVTYDSSPDVSTLTASALSDSLQDVPLVDPDVVAEQFERTQQGRAYYTVRNQLDVDHYEIDGHDRALVLGVRELNQSGIPAGEQTWTNLHTVYTHSNGVIAAYANQRDQADTSTSIEMQYAEGLTEHDLTTAASGGASTDSSSSAGSTTDTFPPVYFGENSPEYSIVGRGADEVPVELSLTGPDTQDTVVYSGEGGVDIGSPLRRLAYAMKFSSLNFLLSERVNGDSKLLYDRDPAERVEKIAPWLTLDSDPYPVVLDNRLVWVIDGYSTTNRFPNSQLESYSTMIDDATQTTNSLFSLPTDQINYMRNSVKAVVDASTGEVNIYAWDADPIMQAWSEVFPGVVQPRTAIPADLLDHLRYPEDLYKVQRYQLARYHVTDATQFLQGSDRWEVPEDPDNPSHLQKPVRMFLPAAGSSTDDSARTWSLTSSFVPYNRDNLSSVMMVDSDVTSPSYGQITVVEGFSQNELGPAQIRNEFEADEDIANAMLPYERNEAQPQYGNVLVVPTAEHGLIDIQPVYAARSTNSQGSYPVLIYVFVQYQGEIAYGQTLPQALSNVLAKVATAAANGDDSGDSGDGTTEPTTPASPSATPSESPSATPSGTPTTEPTTTPSTTPSTGTATVQSLLSEASGLFDQADAAGQAGNFVRREELLQQAQNLVNQAVSLLGQSNNG